MIDPRFERDPLEDLLAEAPEDDEDVDKDDALASLAGFIDLHRGDTSSLEEFRAEQED